MSAVAVEVEDTLDEVLEEHRWMSLLQQMNQAEVGCREARCSLETYFISMCNKVTGMTLEKMQMETILKILIRRYVVKYHNKLRPQNILEEQHKSPAFTHMTHYMGGNSTKFLDIISGKL